MLAKHHLKRNLFVFHWIFRSWILNQNQQTKNNIFNSNKKSNEKLIWFENICAIKIYKIMQISASKRLELRFDLWWDLSHYFIVKLTNWKCLGGVSSDISVKGWQYHSRWKELIRTVTRLIFPAIQLQSNLFS